MIYSDKNGLFILKYVFAQKVSSIHSAHIEENLTTTSTTSGFMNMVSLSTVGY